jgi:hypothetical protein
MKKKLSVLIASGAVAAMATVGSVSPVSAAHCDDKGKPGHSDFAAHVRAASHKEGTTHKGWSTCQETSANYIETTP